MHKKSEDIAYEELDRDLGEGDVLHNRLFLAPVPLHQMDKTGSAAGGFDADGSASAEEIEPGRSFLISED
jgi:hypothetical protein